MNGAWVLVSDSMDYGQVDTILGVFPTREAGQDALTTYLTEALKRHPSNSALLGYDYTLTLWQGTEELEIWTKSGANPWQRH